MMKKTFSYYLLFGGQCLFLLLFSSLVIQIIFSTKTPCSIFKDVSLARIAFCVMMLGGILTCYIYYCKKNTYKKYNKIFVIVMCLLWLNLQGLYIYSTYSQTSSDAYVTNFFAWNLTHGIESEEFYWQYFARYQNNIPLLALLAIFYSIIGSFIKFENTWIIIAVLAGLFANMAIYWTVKLSRCFCFQKNNGLYSFVCAVLLIGLSEESTIFYTDIVTLWTIPCSLYYSFLAFEERKKPLKNTILSGIILGIGGAFKPQVFIILVATLIVRGLMFVHSFYSIYAKPMLKYFLLFLATTLVTYFLLSGTGTIWYASELPAQYNGKTYLDEQKYPSTHWINMGLNNLDYGAYSLDDVAFTGDIQGTKAKNEALLASIKQRLEAMSLKDFLIYENNKVVLALQNGTFSQNMVWKGTLLNSSSLALMLQPHFVSIYPEWINGIGLIIQIIYIMVLILCLYLVFKYLQTGRWFRESSIQIMVISLIGAVCFIMLLERNIRYFYSMVPILITLSSKSIELIINSSQNKLLR